MTRYNSNWGSHDQLQELRKMNMEISRDRDKWRNLAIMMSHFDICTSARVECQICHEARQAYMEARTSELNNKQPHTNKGDNNE